MKHLPLPRSLSPDAILDAAGDGIYALDRHGRCTYANPAALEALGHTWPALAGRNLHEVIHHRRVNGDPFPEDECPALRAARLGVDHTGEDTYWRADGSPLPVRIAAFPLLERGELVGSVVSFGIRQLAPELTDARATELREAIRAGRLVVHYQPVLNIRDDACTGVEALVRWQHPVLGLVGPDAFVGLAETSGSIGELTLAVVRGAVADAARWRAAGRDLWVAVNLSPIALRDATLPDEIIACAAAHRLPAHALHLEVTESVSTSGHPVVLDNLNRLAAAGFPLALDDFGTGYSSLTSLRELPISIVKIDRQFVQRITTDLQDAVVVRAVIEMAHALGRQVVAEGVECAEALAQLSDLGCGEGQGYHWSRPVAGADLEAWLDARSPVRREGFGARQVMPWFRGAVPGDDDADRVRQLVELGVLDTPRDPRFDDIVAVAAQICGTPIAAVSLVDETRQWFKAEVGLGICETGRDVAFCAHAIKDPTRLFIVPDAALDPRFAQNPLVLGQPNIRFYAGAPLVTGTGVALGSLCVIDRVPRQLRADQQAALEALARHVSALIEMDAPLNRLEQEHEAFAVTAHSLLTSASVIRGSAESLGDPRIDDAQRDQLLAMLDRHAARSCEVLEHAARGIFGI